MQTALSEREKTEQVIRCLILKKKKKYFKRQRFDYVNGWNNM